MSSESPSYFNYVDAEPYVDQDVYGDPYMDLGGGADPDAGRTPLLEKDYCTNFTCCGLTLADLHELVSHFEECHVMVVGPNGETGRPTGFPALGMHVGGSFTGTDVGTRLGTGAAAETRTSKYASTPTDEAYSAVTPQYSSSSAPSTAPSSSLNSPISPYASPSPKSNLFPTLTSAYTPSETREGESAFASVTVATEEYDYGDNTAKDYTAIHAQSHVQNHAQNLPTEQRILGLSFDTLLHPSAYATPASLPPATPASVVPEHTIYATNPLPSSTAFDSPRSSVSANTATTDAAPISMDPQPIAPTPIYARHPSLSIITDLPSISNQKFRTTDHNSNSKRRRAASTKGTSRQREKTHKCPRPKCIKSYLNFNGLKYHLEKGTCDFGQK